MNTQEEKMVVIETQGLGKTYDNGVEALADLTLAIPAGEIFGLLGPNGAGKSTTVRLLNGTLTPTAGDFLVLSRPSGDEQIRKSTSTVTESAQLYEHMTAADNLHFFAQLYDIDANEATRRIDELFDELGLGDRKNDKFGSFSTGMRKRVQLARALLNRPRILFLDEPTAGLDPESARQVVELVQMLAAREETTVLLCTHNLPLAEQICTRYGFLVDGSLAWTGTREELLNTVMPVKTVRVTSERGVENHAIANERQINSVIRSVMEDGAHVQDVRLVKPSLEEAYFRIVGASTGDDQLNGIEMKESGGTQDESIAS